MILCWLIVRCLFRSDQLMMATGRGTSHTLLLLAHRQSVLFERTRDTVKIVKRGNDNPVRANPRNF
jgi:hypothetical protein